MLVCDVALVGAGNVIEVGRGVEGKGSSQPIVRPHLTENVVYVFEFFIRRSSARSLFSNGVIKLQFFLQICFLIVKFVADFHDDIDRMDLKLIYHIEKHLRNNDFIPGLLDWFILNVVALSPRLGHGLGHRGREEQ